MFILLFFQNIRNPFLTFLANLISFLGEEPIPVLFTLLLFWCISKKQGIAFICSIFTAIDAMQSIKCIARYPRPFVVYPDMLNPLRLNTATGYTFPSGHSTTSGVFYGLLARFYKSTPLRAISIALIILVPVSRLYLGVHWPIDVITGTILGLLVAFMLPHLFIHLYDNKKAFSVFAIIAGMVLLSFEMLFAYFLDSKNYDVVLWKDIMECFGMSAGSILGLCFERNFVNFEIIGSWKRRAINFACGVISGAVLFLIIRLIPIVYLAKGLSMTLFCFWVTGIYPMIAKKLHLLG